MKTPLILLVFASTVLLCGCGTFQSSAEYQRTSFANDVKRDIDRQIRAEIFKEPPPGSTASTYSASDWSRYWAKEVARYRTDFPKSKDYQGPSGATLAAYIVDTRRAEGLPDLPADGK